MLLTNYNEDDFSQTSERKWASHGILAGNGAFTTQLIFSTISAIN